MEPKKHKVLDKKILGPIALFIIFVLLVNLIDIPLVLLDVDENMASALSSILGAGLLLLGYQSIFRKEFDGVLGWSTEGLILSLGALLLASTNLSKIAQRLMGASP